MMISATCRKLTSSVRNLAA